jgi:hypothetical protein
MDQSLQLSKTDVSAATWPENPARRNSLLGSRQGSKQARVAALPYRRRKTNTVRPSPTGSPLPGEWTTAPLDVLGEGSLVSCVSGGRRRKRRSGEKDRLVDLGRRGVGWVSGFTAQTKARVRCTDNFFSQNSNLKKYFLKGAPFSNFTKIVMCGLFSGQLVSSSNLSS